MVGDTTERGPDELFRDALVLRALLDDLGPHEHAMRSRLLLARDELRAEAAELWRSRGWRAITDSR